MAGHAVHSGLNHDASKLTKLGFPQAQKAEIGSASPPNGHGSHQGTAFVFLRLLLESLRCVQLASHHFFSCDLPSC